MPARFLLDTDVLVECLRGRQEALDFLGSLEGELFVSAISVAELWAGAREGEFESLERFLSAFGIVPVDAEIARRGGETRREYGPSHATGLGDALIFSAAERENAILCTFNRKHFPMASGLRVPYRRR